MAARGTLAGLVRRACEAQGGTEMEEAVERALVGAGALRLTDAEVEAWRAGDPPPPGFWYARNPNGQQNAPDFLLSTPAGPRELELKSSRTANPMWNGGVPRSARLYAFRMPHYDRPEYGNRPVLLVPGSALTTMAAEAAFDEIREGRAFQEAARAANEALARAAPGWRYTVRNMFDQTNFADLYADPARLARQEAEADAMLGGLGEVQPAHGPATLAFYAATPAAARKARGQFMTPRPLAEALREMLRPHVAAAPPGTLEPAAGTGALLSVALDLGRDPAGLVAHELEPALAAALREAHPRARVEEGDFLLAPPPGGFGLVLANPPYVELRKTERRAEYAERYAAYAGGRGNVYGMFVVRCVEALAPGGVAGFIIPDKFGSAPTDAAARARLADLCEVLAVREAGRFDIGVCQSVLLLAVRRRAAPAPLPHPHVVARGAGVVIVADDAAHARWAARPTVATVGCEVSTGGLVWNDHKAAMDPAPTAESPFVLYSANIPAAGGDLRVGVRLGSARSLAKAQHMRPGTEARGRVEPPFVALTRIAGGGRIRAVLVRRDDPAVAGRPVYCENHVNVIQHADVGVLERVLASLRSPEALEFLRQTVGGGALTMSLAQVRSIPVGPDAVEDLAAGVAAVAIA